MFRRLRVRDGDLKVETREGGLTAEQLAADPALVITLRQVNDLPENARKRVYRTLVPASLLSALGVAPVTWASQRTGVELKLKANPESGLVNLSVSNGSGEGGAFLNLELEDNAFNGIDLHLLQLADPASPYIPTDYDADGNPTLFGTLHRNLDAEQRAMNAGLAPGQTRLGLRASSIVLSHVETFLTTLGHTAYFLEPLTYASAWLFERRGFAYVRGHKLMDDIQREFQAGGVLAQALDGSTPFRMPGAGQTVRGRAWAIHDGVLELIGERWDGLRMVKQVGKHAGVETFPGARY